MTNVTIDIATDEFPQEVTAEAILLTVRDRLTEIVAAQSRRLRELEMELHCGETA